MTTPDYAAHNFVDGSAGGTPITAAILNDDEAAIRSLHAGRFNVVDYGADKTGVADAGTAIQNAINAASTAGGGTVYFPAGTYLLNAALTLKSRVTLLGDGVSGPDTTGTRIYQNSGTAACLSAVDQNNITIENVTLVGTQGTTNIGVSFTRSTKPDFSGSTFRRMQVTGFGTGFDLSNPITSTFDRVMVDTCVVGYNIHGVTGSGGSAGTSCTFLNCYANGITQSGFRLDNMAYCTFVGCASDNAGIAYELVESGTQGISFTGCGCESTVNRSTSYPGIGWKINAAVGVSLAACYSYNPVGTSVWVTGSAQGVSVTSFSENTPQAAVVNSIKVDAGCRVNLGALAVIKPTSLAARSTSTTTTAAYNVMDYGAAGDGVADDTTKIQAALNATPAGGICDLPVGTYAVSAPLVIPPGVTFRGAHSDTLNYTGALASPCNLKVLAGFTGAAAVVLQGKFEGSYATHNVGTRVERITVDGSSAPASIKGFRTFGFVREATFDRCTVTKITGNGFAVDVDASSTDPSTSAQSLRFLHCVADNVGGTGFQMNAVPDTTWIDCNAQGAGVSGFVIAGSPNGQMIGCRSEWSTQQGYYITSGSWGTGNGSGGFNMFGCLTDRNGINGVYIDATGSAAINLTGCTHRRDGRTSTTNGYAAVNVAAAATMPVSISNIQVYPGVDDGGTGNLSPQIGVSAPTGGPVTMVSAGYVHAATTATSGGTNFFVSHIVGTATGPTATPTRTAPSVP